MAACGIIKTHFKQVRQKHWVLQYIMLPFNIYLIRKHTINNLAISISPLCSSILHIMLFEKSKRACGNIFTLSHVRNQIENDKYTKFNNFSDLITAFPSLNIEEEIFVSINSVKISYQREFVEYSEIYSEMEYV